MSLNSLASSRVAREAATKKGTMLLTTSSEDGAPRAEDVQNALSALIEYVPAETITLYLAVASALSVLQGFIGGLTAEKVYWSFAGLTPVLYALIYAGKRRAQGEPRWPGVRNWPWWPMIAATIAFMAWGLSGPNRPYFNGEGGDVVVGLLAVIVSAILGVVARFFVIPTKA